MVDGLRRRRIFFKLTFTFFWGGGPALPWAEALSRWSAGDWGLVRRRRRRGAAGGASNQPTTSNSDTSSTLTLLLVTLHLKCFISCQTERQEVKQSRSSWCHCLQVDTSSTSRLTLASTHINVSGTWSFSDTPVCGGTPTKHWAPTAVDPSLLHSSVSPKSAKRQLDNAVALHCERIRRPSAAHSLWYLTMSLTTADDNHSKPPLTFYSEKSHQDQEVMPLTLGHTF